MNKSALINTPWDAIAFGIDTHELADASAGSLQQATATAGHHTVRVDPLASKQLLDEYGFYYCDTLLEPYCNLERLKSLSHPDCTVAKDAEWQALLAICHGAFAHGRFHRDFNLDRESADIRYDNWLRQLYDRQTIYGLFWRNELTGFIAYSDNRLLLHAVAKAFRGKGYAKYWWSAVCAELFNMGHTEVKSSISAANVGALNLYASLGFSFRNPQDIYHRLVK